MLRFLWRILEMVVEVFVKAAILSFAIFVVTFTLFGFY